MQRDSRVVEAFGSGFVPDAREFRERLRVDEPVHVGSVGKLHVAPS
jgi:hypothetical protein